MSRIDARLTRLEAERAGDLPAVAILIEDPPGSRLYPDPATGRVYRPGDDLPDLARQVFLVSLRVDPGPVPRA